MANINTARTRGIAAPFEILIVVTTNSHCLGQVQINAHAPLQFCRPGYFNEYRRGAPRNYRPRISATDQLARCLT